MEIKSFSFSFFYRTSCLLTFFLNLILKISFNPVYFFLQKNETFKIINNLVNNNKIIKRMNVVNKY